MYDKILTDVVSAVQELTLGTEGQEDFGSKDWDTLVTLELRVGDNNAGVDMFRVFDAYSSSPHPDIANVVELVPEPD
jgi:hypothetical protein